MSETELPKQHVVYCGERLLHGGKLGEAYVLECVVADMEKTSDYSFYLEQAISVFPKAKAKELPKKVGGVYITEATIEDDRIKTIKPSIAEYLNLYPDKAAVIALEVMHTDAKARYEQERVAKRLAGMDVLQREIHQLRVAYNKTPRSARLAFELYVIQKLRNSSS